MLVVCFSQTQFLIFCFCILMFRFTCNCALSFPYFSRTLINEFHLSINLKTSVAEELLTGNFYTLKNKVPDSLRSQRLEKCWWIKDEGFKCDWVFLHI